MREVISTPYENMRFFKAHNASLFECVTGDGEVYVGMSDRPWVYMNCKESDPEACHRLLMLVPEEYVNFALVEDWMVYIITRAYARTREIVCTRLYLPEGVTLPSGEIQVNAFQVSALMVEDAVEIQNSHAYNEYTDLEYVTRQIENGYGAGVRLDGKLVAWAITHDDGAIGFLFVHPEHRGKGYGEAVTAWIAERLRKDGYSVYVHIEADNFKSMNLAKKVGFVVDRNVRWFTLER
jgi:8-oxo-dGTP diphosphatase